MPIAAIAFVPFLPPPPRDIDLRTLLHTLFTPPLLLLLLGPGSFEFAAENGVAMAGCDDAECCCRSCVRPRTRLGLSMCEADDSLKFGFRRRLSSIAFFEDKAWTVWNRRDRVEGNEERREHRGVKDASASHPATCHVGK